MYIKVFRSLILIYLFFSYGVVAKEGITLRVSSYLSPLSHSVKSIYEPWMKSIVEASGGEIAFEVYWGGSLGRSAYKQYDLVKAGVTEIGLVQPSYTPGQFPQMQVFELPFMMRSSTEASLAAWKLYQLGVLNGFEDVKLLGLWTAEPSNLFTRDGARQYDDIRGLKIRSVGRLEGDFLNKLGAVPEALHPSDAVEALRRGTLDGVIQGWIALNTFQTYRETDHVITAPLGTVSFALMMNKDVWKSIPRHLKIIIDDNSGKKIALIGGEAYDRRQKEISSKLKKQNHLTFEEADLSKIEEMQNYVEPIAQAWMKRTQNGKETLSLLYEILKDIRSE